MELRNKILVNSINEYLNEGSIKGVLVRQDIADLILEFEKQKEVIEKLVAALEHAKQFVSSGVIESALLTAKEQI